MSKGDMPVGYIIAIVLGIIVLAVLGYWLFVTGGGAGGVVSETTCRGKFLNYCTLFSVTGYTQSPSGAGKTFIDGNLDCKPHQSKLIGGKSEEEACKELLRQTSP